MGNVILPKSLRFLPFQPYDPENKELEGVGLLVWVDPPSKFMAEYNQIQIGYTDFLQAAIRQDRSKRRNIFRRLVARLKMTGERRVDACRHALYAWYARLWSQGPADTRWTVEELERIDEHNGDFLGWLYRSSLQMIAAHRAEIKKGWRPPAQDSSPAERPATQP